MEVISTDLDITDELIQGTDLRKVKHIWLLV